MTYKISATITQNTGIHNFLFNSSKSNVRLSLHINSVQQEITESQFQGPQMMGGPQPQMNSFKQDKDNQNGSKDQMAGVGNQGSKIQWISNSAMMAANQQTPWRIYFKDTIILWVGLGILTVLILTGSLTDLGFLIGEAIQKAIETLKF